MVKVTIANNIRIEQPPSEVARKLIDKYTVSNPEFYRLERMGKWTGNTPEKLALWEREGKTLILPSGALKDALYALSECVIVTSNEKSDGGKSCDYGSKISLYPYQESAVNAALMSVSGVLVAPCGSGKTQMGLEIAARLGLRTLWLTHTHDLLNQSMNRAKEMFGLPASAFGAITAGKVEIGDVITFATVQTMVKLDLSKYRDMWGCVIVDEAHHVAGTPTKIMQFSKVIGSLNAMHKFGLTATPKRADGLIACMYAYIGPKVYEITQEDVGSKICPVKYQFIDTGWDCDPFDVVNPDGTLNYAELVNMVCDDESRNSKIVSKINKIVAESGGRKAKVLVLTERVSHANQLNYRLACCGITGSEILTGATKKEDRQRCLQRLRSSDMCNVLIATYQLAKEGLDVPELTHLVLASPNKTDTTITQAAGRVARACDGKEFGTVIDFNDEFMPLKTWTKKRERIYKRLNYKPI